MCLTALFSKPGLLQVVLLQGFVMSFAFSGSFPWLSLSDSLMGVLSNLYLPRLCGSSFFLLGQQPLVVSSRRLHLQHYFP